MRKVVAPLTIALLVGMLILGRVPISVSLAAVQDNPLAKISSGLDVVALLDSTNYSSSSLQIFQAMQQTSVGIGQYLGERSQLQTSDELHYFSVIPFASEPIPVLPMSSLPLSASNKLSLEQTIATSSNLKRASPNFEAAFKAAQDQFNSISSTEQGKRTRVVFLFAQDPLGSGNGLDTLRQQTNRIANLIKSAMPDTYVFILGFEPESHHWKEFDSYWKTVTNTAQPSSDITVVTIDTIESKALNILRKSNLLPEVGQSIASDKAFTIPPYQASFSVFYFHLKPGDSAQLIPPNSTDQIQLENSESDGTDNTTSVLQTLTVRNPTPGAWKVILRSADGGRPSVDTASRELELTKQAGQFVQEIHVNNQPIQETLVNRPMQIVWKPLGWQDQIIQYADDKWQLDVSAHITHSTDSFDVILRPQPDGTYSGNFYGVKDGLYTSDITATLNGSLYPTNHVDFNLKPVELVLPPYSPAQQFDPAWKFTVQIQAKDTNDGVPPIFASPPTLTAQFLLANGVTRSVNMGQPSQVAGLYTSEPVDLYFAGDVPLEVHAFVKDFNNQSFEIPTRAPNAKTIISISPDLGEIKFSDNQPRLLDMINITYRPSKIDAGTLANRYGVKMFAQIQETGDDSTTWKIPIGLVQPTDGAAPYFSGQFYATRDVAHNLSAIGEYTTSDNKALTIIDFSSGQKLMPRPIVVELESSGNPSQFQSWNPQFVIKDGDSPLKIPFTSQPVISPQVIVMKNGAAVDTPLKLTAVENDISRYQVSYTFIRSGSYDLDVSFEVPQYPTGIEVAKQVSLPVGNTVRVPINVTATRTVLDILTTDASPASVSASPVLDKLMFTLKTNDITEQKLIDTYGTKPQLLLTYIPDGGQSNVPAQSWSPTPIEMTYVADHQQFESFFRPALAGTYRVEMQVKGRSEYGDIPLISQADIGARNLSVRPLQIGLESIETDHNETVESQVRQTDALSVTISLREENQIYRGTNMDQPPDVTVQIVSDQDNTVISKATATYDAKNFFYRANFNPISTPGYYQILVEGLAEDTTGQRFKLPTTASGGRKNFKVVETKNLVVEVDSSTDQYSTGGLPFTPRLPLQVDVRLKGVAIEGTGGTQNMAVSEDVDSTLAIPDSSSNWYTFQVMQNNQVIGSCQVRDPQSQADGTSNEATPQTGEDKPICYVSLPQPQEGGVMRYTISGLPDGNYSIQVITRKGLEAKIPYHLPENTIGSSLPVNYHANPLQYGVGVLAVAAVGGLSGFAYLKRREAVQRFPANYGYIYLTDSTGRTFWKYNLASVKENKFLIIKNQGDGSWGRALVKQIMVETNPRLTHQKQMKLHVETTRGPFNPNPLSYSERVQIDGRFWIVFSDKDQPLHTLSDELNRIKPAGGIT